MQDQVLYERCIKAARPKTNLRNNGIDIAVNIFCVMMMFSFIADVNFWLTSQPRFTATNIRERT
jgi:hypothetical protein